ncbi:MAG: RICIN domain-containing protein [Clostridia bacterium]|nr:RICIN domain-containing protein [Clostridia bacterium]
MKKRIFLWGFVCLLLCTACFVLPVSADAPDAIPDTSVDLAEAEIATASTPAITPADDFVKIGEQQQYTCTGATGSVTWSIRDTNIATVSSTGLVTGISQGVTYLSANVDGTYLTVTIKVGALEEGTYFIGNKGSGKYMDLEGAASADGTPIQQWTFHGGIQSRWIITMESYNYYSIRCAYTNKYIGVEDSSTSGSAAIKQYSSVANQKGRQWSITVTSSGAYRFTPRTATYMALSLPTTGTNDDGTDLVQLGYVNDTNYRDEWVVYSLNQQVNLDIMYDNAYLSRYPDAYNQLINQLVALQQVYIENFGIFVNYDTPAIFSSYADSNCTASHTSTCNHVGNSSCANSGWDSSNMLVYQSYHHNNIYNNLLRISFPNMSSTTRMVFFGRECCASIDGAHYSHPYYGLTYYNLGLISITNFISLESELKTIVHEFGHLYFAPDHYGGSTQTTAEIKISSGDSRYSENCIYGENKDEPDIIENLTICEGCKAQIAANFARFAHS